MRVKPKARWENHRVVLRPTVNLSLIGNKDDPGYIWSGAVMSAERVPVRRSTTGNRCQGDRPSGSFALLIAIIVLCFVG
jgi:hypothetical protein